MASFYSNENFPLPAVELLRAMGHDVLTSRETGKINQSIPDEDVLAYAASLSRCLLTQDKDFFVLHEKVVNHAGIIHTTVDLNYQRLASNICEMIKKSPSLKGQLFKVRKGYK